MTKQFNIGDFRIEDNDKYESLRRILKEHYEAINKEYSTTKKDLAKAMGVTPAYLGKVLGKKSMKIQDKQADKIVVYLNRKDVVEPVKELAQGLGYTDSGILEKLAEAHKESAELIEKGLETVLTGQKQLGEKVEGYDTKIDSIEKDLGKKASTTYVDKKVKEASLYAGPKVSELLEEAKQIRKRCENKLKAFKGKKKDQSKKKKGKK